MDNKRCSSKFFPLATLLLLPLLSCGIFQIMPPTPTPTATSTLMPTATSTLIPTATLTPTQVELGQRHTESAGGFSYIPPTGWDVVEYSGSKYKIAQGVSTGNFKPNINFVDETFSDSLDKYVDASVSSLTQTLRDARIVDLDEFMTNDGQRCLKVVIEDTQSGMKLNQTFYFFDAGTKKFVATYSRLADSGQENDILVDQSMKTFRLEGSSSTTYLSQFQPTLIELPFGEYSVGEFAFTSPYPEDPVRKGDPIVVHGVRYPQGIFAHAPSRLVYEIGKGNFEQLSATLGLVELINNGISCGDGANFVVLVDGEEIYRSDRLYVGSEPVDILLPIDGGDELTLVVEDGGDDNIDCDWAVWGDPRLH